MNNAKIAAVLATGLGLLAIAYYYAKGKPAKAPGAGGPSANAGGAVPARAATSASGGSQGSIPNIIAASAALTRSIQLDTSSDGITEAPTFLPQIPNNDQLLLSQPGALGGGGGGGFVADESLGTVQLPGLGDFGPDIAGNVSALDVGGTDVGTVYA